DGGDRRFDAEQQSGDRQQDSVSGRYSACGKSVQAQGSQCRQKRAADFPDAARGAFGSSDGPDVRPGKKPAGPDAQILFRTGIGPLSRNGAGEKAELDSAVHGAETPQFMDLRTSPRSLGAGAGLAG